MPATIVGKVKTLTLYPVKSMRGVNVDRAQLYWYGLNGDRKYAFVKTDARSGFPWLTARDLPDLLSYQPYFEQPETPTTSALRVVTSEGKDLALNSPELKTELGLGENVSLLKLSRGTFDCMPVSLLSSSSLQSLETHLGEPPDPRRFRANIVLETVTDGTPETTWQGATLRFGERTESAQVQLNYPIQRCMMINLDPETGETDPSMLKEVAGAFDTCLGVYGAVQTLGDIRVGDAVYLE